MILGEIYYFKIVVPCKKSTKTRTHFLNVCFSLQSLYIDEDILEEKSL